MNCLTVTIFFRKFYFIFYLLSTFETTQNTMNNARFTRTTVAPVGVSKEKEIIIPAKKQNSETTTELIITERKLLKIRIEVRDGKIINAEISSVPIILIPITIVNAVKTAISILYAFVLTPVAFEKSSSKVTAKILL